MKIPRIANSALGSWTVCLLLGLSTALGQTTEKEESAAAGLAALRVLQAIPIPAPSTATLFTREWKIPAEMIPRLPAISPATDNSRLVDREAVKQWLIDRGVVFRDLSSAIYIPRSNRLIVRNTQDQLDVIDALFVPDRSDDPQGKGENVPVGLKVDPRSAAAAARVQPNPPPPGTLLTREWKVPADLIPRVSPPAAATPGSSRLVDRESAKKWLIGNGIVFQGQASAVYIMRSSRLIVRNTQDQLDLIDVLIEKSIPTDPAMEKKSSETVIPKLELKEATPADDFNLTDGTSRRPPFRADAVITAIDLKERRVTFQPIEDYGYRPPMTWTLTVRDEVIAIDWLGRGPALKRAYFLEDLHVGDRVLLSTREDRTQATAVRVRRTH